jgi:pimeloyl-ACP methyl ester carboxylesterase
MKQAMIGNGPERIIALHGWFGTGFSLNETLGWLDPARYTAIAPDYRGYGTRKNVLGDYTIDEIADDILTLADSLGWNSFHLLGHSMGAKAALQVLAKAPERVRSLVAVTPVPPGAVPFDEATFAFFRSAAGDPASRAGIIAGSVGGRHSNAFVARLVRESIDCSRQEAFASYLESWVGEDISGQVHGLNTRVLVIAGQHDAVLGVETMKQAFIPHFPNSELIEMEACGHYPNFETPVALASEIDRFLSA